MSTSNVDGSTQKREKNHYVVLDLTPGVTQNDILHAFNRAKATYSGNSLAAYSLMDDEENVAVLEEIEEAYRILGNPMKRREYDVRMGFQTWGGAGEERSRDYADFAHRSNVQTIAAASLANAANLEKKKHLIAVPALPESDRNSDFEREISEIKDITGAFIRSVRIYRQLSQDQLAQLCKLSLNNLAIIEGEMGEEMTHPTYVRGHVMLISQVLGLPEPALLAKSYIARMKSAGHFASTPLF